MTKRYGTKLAVERLSLKVAAGELFAFLGPNGAGKTTTIKMLCGLLFPTEGTIRVGGFDMIAQGDEARKLISYVPDQPFLYEKLTGREFLQFIADLYDMETTHAERRMREVIDLFALHEFVDDLTERYSHGMRQRTVFAAALIHEPKLLIVDEPTVGLDPKSIRMLKDLLRAESKKRHDRFPVHPLVGHCPGTGGTDRYRRTRAAHHVRHVGIAAETSQFGRLPGGRVLEADRGSDPGSGAGRMSKAISQTRLFRRLRWRLFNNSGTQLLSNSRVRFYSMIASSMLVWAAMYAASHAGFQLLASQKIPTGLIIELLFNAMFFTLGGMLVFSTALVLYASLFNGAETRFLLTTPAKADHVFASKYQSAIFFSSWAFVVLGLPVLLAYGFVNGVPWYYFALLPVFFLGYVMLPGGIGAILCILWVNLFPHRKKQALIVAMIGVVGGLVYWVYRTIVAARDGMDDRDKLQGLFDMFALARGSFSPADWMARGLLSVSRGEPGEAMLPLALIWSNGLMLYVVATWLAKHYYRRGYNRMATGGDLRRKYSGTYADRVMELLVFYLDRQTRVLIVKDFRTFRREPAQIGQLVIFVGLLLLAVLNSRQFFDADIPTAYQHGLSLLNMSATGLLMCAYLGRFIYPLISLGRPQVLDTGLVAVETRTTALGQIRLRGDGQHLPFGKRLVGQ